MVSIETPIGLRTKAAQILDFYLRIIQVWQSRVEIEHYSVAYLDRITVFEVL